MGDPSLNRETRNGEGSTDRCLPGREVGGEPPCAGPDTESVTGEPGRYA